MAKDKNHKAITINFPKDVGDDLLVAEIREDRSRHDIAAEAVREYFANRQEKAATPQS